MTEGKVGMEALGKDGIARWECKEGQRAEVKGMKEEGKERKVLELVLRAVGKRSTWEGWQGGST